MAGPWRPPPVLNLASPNATGLLNPNLSQSTNVSTLDKFTPNNATVYPIAGTSIYLVIAAYEREVLRTDTLMLFITAMYAAIAAISPRGDVRFRRGEETGFAYKSRGMLVINTSQTARGLTYSKVGVVAKGLGLFAEAYGYFLLEFEIHEVEVGKIGRGRTYRSPVSQAPS